MNIGIYIYNQAEVLDFSGPFEVFSTATRVCEEESPFEVFLIGQTGETVNARARYRVIPDYVFHNHPPLDVLEGVRWVDQGEVITSGGISAGIDMSLHLVAKLHDEALAHKTARQMEFAWTRNT